MLDDAILICIIGLIAHRFRAWLPGKNFGLIAFPPAQDHETEKQDHDQTLLALLIILCVLLWADMLA